ncbi:hypothetical protein Tco_0601361 [Tanacetum coccineum]
MPQLRSNTKNDRVPSASMSSCIKNKELEVEEHPRNLLLSKNKKQMSSECNNVKLVIRNDKYEVVCALCKQCLITGNHDVFYVNGMNSRSKKQKAKVPNIANQTKLKPQVKKPKKVGSNERLASPKPSKPRSCLRWSLTGRIFDLKGKIITTSEFECQSDCSNGDNACTSNPQEPTIKRFPNYTSFLGSSGLDLTYAPSTITTQQLTKRELDLLFEAMYNDYIGGQPSAATRTAPADQAPQVLQTPTVSTTIVDTALRPTTSSSKATNIPNTSSDVGELETQQQHVQQQNNQALLQPKTVADNVSNAMFDGNTFVNLFATPSISATESSSLQYVDPSNMHTFYQPYPHKYQWTKDHPLEQVIGELMTSNNVYFIASFIPCN